MPNNGNCVGRIDKRQVGIHHITRTINIKRSIKTKTKRKSKYLKNGNGAPISENWGQMWAPQKSFPSSPSGYFFHFYDVFVGDC